MKILRTRNVSILDHNGEKQKNNDQFFTKNLESIIDFNLEGIKSKLKYSKNLLVFGEVQSGKTENILSLSTAALERWGYDMIILFGGTNTVLLNQTIERIKNKNMKFHEMMVINGHKELKKYPFESVIESDKLVWINIMKESVSLSELKNQLKNTKLSSKKILIIDDESDFGSINTKKIDSTIGKNNGSAFYDLISKIKNTCSNTSFLMFTATPYANLVSNRSISTKPDDIFFLKHPENYTGLSFFNQKKYLFNLNLFNKEDYNEERNWDILSEAFLDFLFFSVLKNINKPDLKKTEMLINIDVEKEKHIQIMNIMNDIVSSYKPTAIFNYFFAKQIEKAKKRGINIPDDINKFHSLINEMYKEITILKAIDYSAPGSNLDQIYNNIRYLNEFDSDYITRDKYNIIIGGNLISRGVTFGNLIVEILFSEPSDKNSADTLAQRARWLGYRGSYSEYMNIYTSEKIYNAFLEIEALNNQIVNDINSQFGIEKIIEDIKSKKFEFINLTGGAKNAR